jgi:predicted Fe-Mo cluster-binding NifX family protein
MMRGELLRKIRLAIPTRKSGGIDDVVSDVFGRTKTFTIIDIEGKEVTNLEVIQNPAASYKHGSGSIAVKTLSDNEVNVVVASEFGPGVSTLLKQLGVAKVEVKRSTRVAEAIQQLL